ncbi:hypothetical protein BCR36DRAFT_579751 [Piromyces finnis]|uniref:Uncharacterized protein n=1 Tax=Piromyces finnis TaxID=1754191 RepID=A0A1Y1VKX9_9FUNG|nr:hypothetical protein BCR36DRAFT_579751 [Piromyces finnis]|eukprot:ORX59118.1 hypothetical protein BCR36DRAFT_579751 [Piromyces finnis]
MTNNNTTAKNNNMISTPVPNNNVMSNNIISNAIPSNYVVYQPPPPQLVILNSYPTPTNSVLPTSNLLVTTPVSTGAPSPSLSVANEPSNSQRNSFHSAPRIVSDNTTDSNADELPPYSLIENDVDENNSTNTNLNSNVTPTNATQLATIAQNQQQQSNSSHSTTNNNNNDTFLTLPEQQIIRPVLPQVTRPPIINAHPPQVIMASTSRNDQQNMLRPVIPMQSWIKKP